ncbi:MAG: helix-turn-helix domain-containing protein [Pseudonocardiaceae bacterium]
MARASSEDVIVLGARRQARMEAIVAKATAPQRLVRRAKIVLAAWRGAANAEIARDLGICVDTVRTGRRRFRGEGMPGLLDRPRSGRPPVYGVTTFIQTYNDTAKPFRWTYDAKLLKAA